MAEILLKNRHHQYEVVAQTINYIRANAHQQPSLKQIADHIGFSEFYLQRVFTEWAGVSPKRFLQFVTKEHAKQALQDSVDVLTAALNSGLSGSGRLHDLMVSCEAMSPGEIKALGAGLEIRYGIGMTPFGAALVGWTSRGVCHFEFRDNDAGLSHGTLLAHWPKATLVHDHAGAINLINKIFSRTPSRGPLHLLL